MGIFYAAWHHVDCPVGSHGNQIFCPTTQHILFIVLIQEPFIEFTALNLKELPNCRWTHINADSSGHRVLGAASGFALGRNQKVRLIERLRKVLQIKWLRPVKTKIEHKKQEYTRLYYRALRETINSKPVPSNSSGQALSKVEWIENRQ